MKPVLVIGLGNAERGDDAVGPQAIDRLRATVERASLQTLPGDPAGLVAAWDGADAVIVIDAALGGEPGEIRRLNAASPEIAAARAPVSSHGAGLAEALKLSDALDATPPHFAIYLVSGARFGLGDRLSPAVAGAIPDLTRRVAREIEALMREEAADA